MVYLSTKAVTGDVLCSMGSTLKPAPTRCAGRTVDFQFLGQLRRVSAHGAQATASLCGTGVNGVVKWDSGIATISGEVAEFYNCSRAAFDRPQFTKPIHCFGKKRIVMHNYCLRT
jgi:hypothetical protein